jgi:hypothetical protein
VEEEAEEIEHQEAARDGLGKNWRLSEPVGMIGSRSLLLSTYRFTMTQEFCVHKSNMGILKLHYVTRRGENWKINRGMGWHGKSWPRSEARMRSKSSSVRRL